MESKTTWKPASCPRCGRTYTTRPCVSREALESIGVGAEEQERILDTIHRHQA